MPVIITGGAGYIGSHTVRYFQEKGEEVIVIDSLKTGHKESVQVKEFLTLDIRDKKQIEKVFKAYDIEAVIHFAADSLVGKSMEAPYEYYHNNVYGMLCLLDAMRRQKVNNIIFSSSAATYGEPHQSPILESDKTEPTNTYGETKLTMEKMMKWFSQAYDMRYVSLRYFNAAGACETGTIGEDHRPETHLIPLILQVPLGKREKIFVFGNDYQTSDGTCVRDYVHVMDIASAHYLSLKHLREKKESNVINLGSGKGYSVKEVIDTARQITGHSIPMEIKGRRPGDPATLIASRGKAKEILGWNPTFNSIEKIILDSWRWHKNNPEGYSR